MTLSPSAQERINWSEFTKGNENGENYSREVAEGSGLVQSGEERKAQRPWAGTQEKLLTDRWVLYWGAVGGQQTTNGSWNGRGSQWIYRKRKFPTKIIKHWTGLSWDAAKSLSLQIFRTPLDKALSNPLWIQCWAALRLQRMNSWGPSSVFRISDSVQVHLGGGLFQQCLIPGSSGNFITVSMLSRSLSWPTHSASKNQRFKG